MNANTAGNASESFILISAGPAAPPAPVQLAAWAAQAAPGEMFEYHRGFLGIDRTGAGRPMSAARRTELIRTSDHALQLAEAGVVDLIQRRVAADTFCYFAVMRRPRIVRRSRCSSSLGAEAA